MTGNRISQRGLTLVETLVAITIFAIMTLGTIPLLGTAMKGGATTRTESVARNVASKTLERLRGFQYYVGYSSTNRKIDLLDHFFPGRTPAYVASVGTGFDAATQTFVTTCDSISNADACATLPDSAEIPEGYVVEVRATFKSATNPATTTTVPVDYAWNGADTPPSDLLEVRVAVVWSVGAEARTYDLRSYLSSHGRLGLPTSGGSSGGGGAPAPTPTPGGATAPDTVKLRGEARIDYGYEITTTYQDGTGRLSEYTGTLGNAIAYGEQLDSGSKAELSVRAGRLRIVRPANPAVVGDAGFDADVSGAILDARAPADATTTVTTTAPAVTATTSEVPASIGSLMASEAGTLTGTRGVSPTVAGGLPFVRGYYDINGTAPVSPISSAPTHFWTLPQAPTAAAGTTDNPLGLMPVSATSQTPKTITISDWQFGGGANVDPRGEVMVDSTATAPAASRMVTSTATIPNHGMVVMLPMSYSTANNGALVITQFSANVSCVARADASAASSATGAWSANLLYQSYEGARRQDWGRFTRTVTLPVQTRSDNPQVPNGTTNPLEVLRNVNNGNGPKIYDTDAAFGDNANDVYLFAANGKRGLLTGLSAGSIQTTISADDRVASAQLNGAIRLETSPLWGPWGSSSKPQSDLTFAMGKLSCRAEDYR
jgi:prepilin-type N-terminal cleavage/methylation domain-containing protein